MNPAQLLPTILKSRIKAWLEQRHTLFVSQGGQDFWVFGEVFNGRRGGYFLDIGAHDGITISNTYLLEKRYAWRGICVEANPRVFEKLKANRRSVCVNACMDAQEGIVEFAQRNTFGGIVSTDTDNRGAKGAEILRMPTITLMRLLDEQRAPAEIDYLSIDIEGAEDRVLSTFDFGRYRFRCITIERPSARLRDLLRRNEYVLVKEIPDLDCFYVHRSFIPQYQDNVFSFYKRRFLHLCWS